MRAGPLRRFAIDSRIPGVASRSACATLRRLALPGIVLSDVTAQWFPAGSPPPAEPPWVPPLTVPLPAYCQLSATIDSRTGADGKSYGIGFALALNRFLFGQRAEFELRTAEAWRDVLAVLRS